jgi:hypothetical protein
MKFGWVLLAAVLVWTCGSCESINLGGDEDAVEPVYVYNKYNVHYYFNKGKYYGSYANYIEPLEHGFLPYNTKLEVGSYRGGFKLTAVETGLEVNIQYKSANMGGMSKDDYVALITSPTPVSYDFAGPDQEGVQQGQVSNGMSKEAVQVAWGYPAKHQTPSLDSNTWVYWKDRYRTIRVVFDTEGKVTSVVR